ncbi:alpha/beta hydrolase [Flavobacterium sp. F-65]|uniref:Alpha/beta hydrolase n=1 Tax=Flavobacterium pisciphilum TaxID=2893755 RepID=A0ABS8MMW5_9FLAO|nr:alpha/beta hydrolase [Flavobacterium sp. F-65]MCC9070116.1 alpha/beta hydrolase [Flavobacterium sp. F-65]
MKNIEKINLWNGNMPTANGLSGEEILTPNEIIKISNISEAELTIYRPETEINTGIATIICPGGGYAGLAINTGYDFAAWLASIGITGIVLKYRLPNGNKEVPLDDVQKAISYVRKNALELGIDKNKIGVTGFSAGGHLAGLASTLFLEEKENNRPDFSILFYPLITMGENTHNDSNKNLLGSNPSASDIERYSCDKQVCANTPPALIFASDDDNVVAPINSIMYYKSLKKHGVNASLYVFPQGDHGWGLNGVDMFGKDFKYTDEVKALIKKWINELFPFV